VSFSMPSVLIYFTERVPNEKHPKQVAKQIPDTPVVTLYSAIFFFGSAWVVVYTHIDAV